MALKVGRGICWWPTPGMRIGVTKATSSVLTTQFQASQLVTFPAQPTISSANDFNFIFNFKFDKILKLFSQSNNVIKENYY